MSKAATRLGPKGAKFIYQLATKGTNLHKTCHYILKTDVFSKAALLKGTPSKALTYCMSCTNLFVVFDFIVEDNAVGSFRLLPGQGDTVSRSLLLSDDCYWWGGWWETQREKKKVSSFMVRFSGSSVPRVASWWLSMVSVHLIQFAAQWGRITDWGPGLKGGTIWCTLMETSACA